MSEPTITWEQFINADHHIEKQQEHLKKIEEQMEIIQIDKTTWRVNFKEQKE